MDRKASPDNRYLLGETRKSNSSLSQGLTPSVSSAGGVGSPRRMDEQAPAYDLWDVDIRRAYPFQSEKAFLAERQPKRWDFSMTCTGLKGNSKPVAAFSLPAS